MKKKMTFLKTMLLAMILLVGSGNVWGQTTVNYTMSSMGLANAALVGTSVRNTTDGNITFTFAQNSSGTAPAYFTTGTAVRLYQNATKGGSIKIMVASGYKITSATVTKASGDGDGPVGYALDGGTEAGSFADGTTSNTTGAINATSSVEFYSKGTSSSTRFYVVSFSVTYDAVGGVTAPTIQASAINFTSIGQTGMTANWTNGNGAKRLVIMNTSNSFTNPTDGSDPSANSAYAGSGEQVVYNNSSNSVAVTGLSSSTTYWFRVFEYNGSGTGTKYITSTATDNPKSQATSAPAPLITLNPTTLTSFTYVQGSGPSTEQTFTVSGSNLTADISIAASTNYEISKTSGSGYTTPLTFTQSGGTVGSTTVYVRLKAGLSVGNFNSETITATSSGATDKTVTCSGNVTTPPAPVAPTATSATSVSASGFTANWGAVSGATGYRLDVYTGSVSEILNTSFEGSTSFPAGWVQNSSYVTNSSADAYEGSYFAGMNAANDYFYTTILSSPQTISFWTKASSSTANNTVKVQYSLNGIDWTDLSTYNANGSNTGSITDSYSQKIINANLTGNYYIRWFMSARTGGSSYFDAIIITGGSQTYVSGFQDYDAGNVISKTITGLNSSTDYYYVVRAYNASGTSANSNEISVTTTTIATPTITVSTSSLTGFTYAASSGPSTEQSFTVSGSDLTNNISITPSTNYEISESSSSGYGSSITLTHSGGTVSSTTIYVRLKAGLTASEYNNEVINITSSGATSKTVTCSGTVISAEPTNHPLTLTATINSSQQITVIWADNDGVQAASGFLVLANTSGTFTDPVDGTPQSDAALVKNIAHGTQTAIFTGLTASTQYFFKIFAYNGSASTINYKTDGFVPTANATTNPALTIPTANTLSNISSTGFNANWNAVSGATGYQLDLSTNSNFTGNIQIDSEGFENALSLFTNSSGNYYSGNSGSSDLPATSPFAVAGTYSFGISNNSAVITSSTINTSSYTGNQLSFRLASFSIGSGGNGADVGDIVTVEISPNGGTNWYTTLKVLGNSNAVWSYAGGSGIASTAYDGNATSVDFQPAGGGSRTTDGYSTITITNLPQSTNLLIKITLLNNSVSERWLIDNLSVTGNLNAMVSGYNNLSVSDTSQAVSGLNANTNYYYRVRATDGTTTTANSSTITALTLPAAPSVTAPATLTNSGFTANWTAPTQGSASFSYSLEYGTDANLSTGTTVIDNITNSSINSVISSLSGNTSYYYRVKAVNQSGSGNWSGIQAALTLPDAPTKSVETNALTTSFTANWTQPANGADGYNVEVATDNSFTNIVSKYEDFGGFVRSNGDLISTFNNYFDKAGWAGDKVYEMAGFAKISQDGYIVTPSIDLSENGGVHTLTFKSSKLSSATTTILVELSINNGSSYSTIASITASDYLTAQSVSITGGTATSKIRISTSTSNGFYIDDINISDFTPLVSGTSKEIKGLVKNTTYYYRIKARNASGNSTYSAVEEVLPITVPSQGASNIGISATINTITINWSKSIDADGCFVKINNLNSFSPPVDYTNYTSQISTTWTGSGEQIVYEGSGSTVTINCNNIPAEYYVVIFEYKTYVKGPFKNNGNAYGQGKVKDNNGNGGNLPINLLSFEAENLNQSIQLTWSTASEYNNDYFTLERSIDGIHFEEIGKVDGAGTSNQVLNYVFIDYKNSSTICYYRLKQTDYDGSFAYSKIISVRSNSNNEFEFTNCWLDNSNQLNIEVVSTNPSNSNLEILNVLGQLIYTYEIELDKGKNVYKMQMPKVTNGMYFIRFESEGFKTSRKIFCIKN